MGSSFTLYDPAGREVGLRELSASGDLAGQTSLLRLMDPLPGVWRLKHLAPQGEAGFNYSFTTFSKLFLKIFPLEKRYLRGQVAHFCVSLAMLEEPMLDAEVIGILRDSADRDVASLTLRDDGVHGDNHAGDGVYCALAPLDYQEGNYTFIARAKGKTRSGEPFSRLEKQNFQLLEGGDSGKDFFLASVLPLYLDLGKVQRGETSTASMRVSFEGRRKTDVSFVMQKLPTFKGSPDKFLFSEALLGLPEKRSQSPSLPEVAQIQVSIPDEALAGEYEGTLGVQMGDYEILVPLVFEVTGVPAVRKTAAYLELTPPAQPTEVSLKALPLKTGPEIAMAPNAEQASLPEEPARDAPADLSPDLDAHYKRNEPLSPISFQVTPDAIASFQINFGQKAFLEFRVINLSSWPGYVEMVIEGEGELDKQRLELAANEERKLQWSWSPQFKKDDLRKGEVSVRFSNGSMDVRKIFSWERPYSKNQALFWLTSTYLLLAAFYHFYLYASSHREAPHHFTLALSNLAHIVLIVWMFFWFIQPAIRHQDARNENRIETKLIKMEENRFEIIPRMDESFREEEASIELSRTTLLSKEALTPPESKPPETTDKTMPVWDRGPVVDMAFEEVEAELRERKVTPVPLLQEKVENRPTIDSQERVSEDSKARDLKVEKTELEPTRERVFTTDDSAPVKAKKINLSAVDTQLSQLERKWDRIEVRRDELPIVLSINDRPTLRAVMSRKPKVEAPQEREISISEIPDSAPERRSMSLQQDKVPLPQPTLPAKNEIASSPKMNLEQDVEKDMARDPGKRELSKPLLVLKEERVAPTLELDRKVSEPMDSVAQVDMTYREVAHAPERERIFETHEREMPMSDPVKVLMDVEAENRSQQIKKHIMVPAETIAVARPADKMPPVPQRIVLPEQEVAAIERSSAQPSAAPYEVRQFMPALSREKSTLPTAPGNMQRWTPGDNSLTSSASLITTSTEAGSVPGPVYVDWKPEAKAGGLAAESLVPNDRIATGQSETIQEMNLKAEVTDPTPAQAQSVEVMMEEQAPTRSAALPRERDEPDPKMSAPRRIEIDRSSSEMRTEMPTRKRPVRTLQERKRDDDPKKLSPVIND
ncbi:MAG: hypothetical protein HQL31_05370 [Planctomycetes bacterium]|nr:hypothetical protein [Planctomycetota bacterium]